MRTLLLAVAAALALAAPAAGGGWATAGLAPPPDEVRAGDTWHATVTILQHGRTPLEGVQPAVIVRNGDDVRRFPARATGKPGVYQAKVKFPSDGTWRYQVDDGFGQTHSFAPVEIRGASGGDGGAAPSWTWLVALGGAALVAALLLLRRVRPAAAPAAQA